MKKWTKKKAGGNLQGIAVLILLPFLVGGNFLAQAIGKAIGPTLLNLTQSARFAAIIHGIIAVICIGVPYALLYWLYRRFIDRHDRDLVKRGLACGKCWGVFEEGDRRFKDGDLAVCEWCNR